MPNTVVIVDAKRTPMGNFNGALCDIPAPTLGSIVMQSLLSHQKNTVVDQVYMGCVLPAGLGQAPARQAALGAKLPLSTPCTTINKMCGSGMQTIILGCRDIQSGAAKTVIAGGMENMSRAPYLLLGARTGLRMGTQTLLDHMLQDGLINAYGDHLSMGELAEDCVKKMKITREEQDAFAIQSIERAIHATQSGFFKNEITPITRTDKKNNTIVISEDEGIQKAQIHKIPQLAPAFVKQGTITAANASSISDGAAAVLLLSADHAEKQGIKPLARIVGDHTIAQAPEWFSTAPIKVIDELLRQLQWKIDDVDLFEINEAFSVVVLAAMKTLSIPHDKINVHGGACILGHPIGASGARIVVTLIHALKQRQKKRGIAAICIGGGEATAIAVELI